MKSEHISVTVNTAPTEDIHSLTFTTVLFPVNYTINLLSTLRLYDNFRIESKYSLDIQFQHIIRKIIISLSYQTVFQNLIAKIVK